MSKLNSIFSHMEPRNRSSVIPASRPPAETSSSPTQVIINGATFGLDSIYGSGNEHENENEKENENENENGDGNDYDNENGNENENETEH